MRPAYISWSPKVMPKKLQNKKLSTTCTTAETRRKSQETTNDRRDNLSVKLINVSLFCLHSWIMVPIWRCFGKTKWAGKFLFLSIFVKLSRRLAFWKLFLHSILGWKIIGKVSMYQPSNDGVIPWFNDMPVLSRTISVVDRYPKNVDVDTTRMSLYLAWIVPNSCVISFRADFRTIAHKVWKSAKLRREYEFLVMLQANNLFSKCVSRLDV